MIIETKPFTDEHGNRQWRTERCADVCIQGSKESHTPQICPWYFNKGEIVADPASPGGKKLKRLELCNRDEACSE